MNSVDQLDGRAAKNAGVCNNSPGFLKLAGKESGLMRMLVFFSFILFLATGAVRGQYNFSRFSVTEGLPQSQVFCLTQDSRGFLWMGTQGGGVCRFDGARFETYTTEEGLSSNFVNAVFEDSDHRIWVGTNQGLCRFDGQRFKSIPLNQNLPVYAVFEERKGRLLIGTQQGICVLDPVTDKFKKLELGDYEFAAVYTFFPTEKGLWAGSARGAYILGDSLPALADKNGVSLWDIRAFARDNRGRLWVASYGRGVFLVDENTLTVSDTLNSPLVNRATSLFADKEGHMWVGTQHYGLVRYDPDGSVVLISEKQGLPHNHVRAIYGDRSGNIWIATSGGGVARYLGQQFQHFDRINGLAGNRIYALCEDRDSRLWMSVSQSGIALLDPAGFHKMDLDSGWIDVKAKTICEDPAGRIWVGTEGKGIAVFDSSGMQRLTVEQGLPGNWIQKIVAEPNGWVWAATYADGIAAIRRDSSAGLSVIKYGSAEGLPDLRINTLLQDQMGRLWFATAAGQVGYLKDGTVRQVFGPEVNLPEVPIRCLYMDEEFKLWVGTSGAGIYTAYTGEDDPYFAPLYYDKKLASQNIYLLVGDLEGNLWVGTENGVDQVVLSPERKIADIRHFGKEEGFLGIETCHDAAVCDRKGNLWFGTINGLTKRVPGFKNKEKPVPVLRMGEVSLFYKPLEATPFAAFADPDGGLKPGLKFPWNQNHLSFRFRAVELSDPRSVRYRWKLEGAEADWAPWSDQTQVNYANLPPGRYTFMVESTTDESHMSEPVMAAFVVLKPFWQHWWFQATAAALVLSVIGLWLRFRIRKVRKQEEAKREKLELENHLLQLEQKALQLQMNPHFIFNALNSIQSLIATRDNDTARQEINGFARLMRSVLTNSRKQKISLSEEIETLRQYLRVEQFCQQNPFEFEMETESEIHPEEVEIPPMLLQPFVENAVIHGVSHLNHPGMIQLRFTLKDDLLCCEIRDNGIGRERAALLRQEKKPGHQSAAMQVTKERLEAMRAGRPYTPLEIEDVLERGVIQGTVVRVRIPGEVGF